MRPNKESRRKSVTRSSSPPRRRTQTAVPSASLLESGLLTQEQETSTLFDGLRISSSPDLSVNPRSFPHSVKQQCWGKADKVRGRDPDRWRRDPLGNIVFKKLVGCPGCLCHDYDHILPYSKVTKTFFCSFFFFPFLEKERVLICFHLLN